MLSHIERTCTCRSFEIGDPANAIFHFGVLVDPVSEDAQKWTPIFEVGDLMLGIIDELIFGTVAVLSSCSLRKDLSKPWWVF